ncbi:hypothetical protein CAEBREN_14119 [Caenorhabditis brenneri]|uniref:Uncharacterized protein n=1 Tax=Caenorhabditis brenneri TaxID=135651 RepID=G0M6J1_CAEBE|nr:hypothetical protein CAEBREN_14119 [Caenorhabditis brenneri]
MITHILRAYATTTAEINQLKEAAATAALSSLSYSQTLLFRPPRVMFYLSLPRQPQPTKQRGIKFRAQ